MIRSYAPADLEQVVSTWENAMVASMPCLSAAFLAAERQSIRTEWMTMAETWVYEKHGRVAGFVALIGDEVGGLFVHPDSQRQGIGRLLLDHALSLRGSLVLDVFEANTSARLFYERYGFRQTSHHLHEATGLKQLRLTYP